MASFGKEHNAIQAAGPGAATVPIAVTTSSATTATLAGNGSLYRVNPEVDIYWDIKTVATTASDKAVADMPFMIVDNKSTALSMISVSASGTVKVTLWNLDRN